jgi:CheY-like chemotaxis protein
MHSKAKRRVMVVDDDDDVRETICDAFVLSGHDAVGAADGRAALDLLRRAHFDLIVTDLRMPGMDGWQLLSALQGDAALRRIPVCVVSGELDAPASAARVIRKPFELASILELLDKLLARRHSHRSAA